jgi:hypothetical protein
MIDTGPANTCRSGDIMLTPTTCTVTASATAFGRDRSAMAAECALHLVVHHWGEEFAVRLRGIALAEAADMLDAVRATVAAKRFSNRETDTALGIITVSAGHRDPCRWGGRNRVPTCRPVTLYCQERWSRSGLRGVIPGIGAMCDEEVASFTNSISAKTRSLAKSTK